MGTPTPDGTLALSLLKEPAAALPGSTAVVTCPTTPPPAPKIMALCLVKPQPEAQPHRAAHSLPTARMDERTRKAEVRKLKG